MSDTRRRPSRPRPFGRGAAHAACSTPDSRSWASTSIPPRTPSWHSSAVARRRSPLSRRVAIRSCSRCSAPTRSRPWSSARCCRPAMARQDRALSPAPAIPIASRRSASASRARTALPGNAGVGHQRAGAPRRRRRPHRRRAQIASAAAPVLVRCSRPASTSARSATAGAPSSRSISFSGSIGWRSPRGSSSPSGWGSIRRPFSRWHAARPRPIRRSWTSRAPRWCAAISRPRAASARPQGRAPHARAGARGRQQLPLLAIHADVLEACVRHGEGDLDNSIVVEEIRRRRVD